MSVDITSLRSKKITDLVDTAHDIGIDNAANLKRQELIFEIVRHRGTEARTAAGAGVLEILPDGFGFLRSTECNYLPGPDDIYVSPSQIRRFNLRTGDLVSGQVRAPKEGERYFALIKIEGVNGQTPDGARNKPLFENLTPVHPSRRLLLGHGDALLPKLIDAYVPIGFGQRIAVHAPPRAGRTRIIRELAKAARQTQPEAELIVLLIDERPEEVTAVQRELDAEVLFSTFDEPAARHVQVADMALERAKRQVEEGKDVILFLDSLSRLVRAAHASTPAGGKLMGGTVDTAALQVARRIFGAARALEEGGSLTMFATLLTGTSAGFDEVLLEDLHCASNAVIALDPEEARRGTYPALNLFESTTRGQEYLLDAAAAKRIHDARGRLTGDCKADLQAAFSFVK
jgi:transcription termination factor Rho